MQSKLVCSLLVFFCLIFKASALDWKNALVAGNKSLLENINWEEIRKLDQRNSSQTIAVIGDGIIPEEFGEMIDKNRKEISDNGIDDDKNGYVDDYYGLDVTKGHGTNFGDMTGSHEMKVASLIAMMSDYNDKQKYPIKIIPISIRDYTRGFDQFRMKYIADAIDYAVMRGARVINLSLGISAYYESFFKFLDNDYKKSMKYVTDAFERAHQRGVIILGASSNDITRNQSIEMEYPANFENVISVTSVDLNNVIRRAFGKNIMTAFYGEDIYLYEGNRIYTRGAGTSYALPMVSTLIAMVLARNRELTPTQIHKKILKASVGKIRGKRSIRGGVLVPTVFLNSD